jgi:GntR family transcriptional regulator
VVAKSAQGGKPRYVEIADDLRAKIAAGGLAIDGKLPSERELSERYGAARNTIRDAIQVLRAQDIIETRRGSGIFLRTFRRLERNSVERLARTQWGTGRSIWDHNTEGRDHQEGVTVEKVKPPEHVAGVLGTRDQEVWRRSRIHREDRRVVQKSTSWFPADIAGGTAITEVDTGPGGVYARLNEIGHGPARYREEIMVRLPLSEEIEALSITQSTPVILISRTAFDDDDRPVEVNEMVLDSDSFRLVYNFPS